MGEDRLPFLGAANASMLNLGPWKRGPSPLSLAHCPHLLSPLLERCVCVFFFLLVHFLIDKLGLDQVCILLYFTTIFDEIFLRQPLTKKYIIT